MDMDAFRAAVQKGIISVFGEMKEHRLTAGDWEAVDRLANIKYKSWDWTFGRAPIFSVKHRIRLESGNVDVCFRVKNGIIRNVEPADAPAQSSSTIRIIERFIGKRYDVKFRADIGSADTKIQ
jgi:lipoate-protein ligase A